MKRFVRLLALTVSLTMVAIHGGRASAGTCGDGIVQAPEQCDPGSPGGVVACPGRCVPPPNLEACSCTAASTDFRDFAVVADTQARLSAGATVQGGGVAVRLADGLLYVATGASIAGDAQAIGDRARLLPSSSIGRLFSNNAIVIPGAFVGDGGPFAFVPPLVLPMLPTFSAASPSSNDVDANGGGTQYLAPGAYGNVTVEPGATLVLHGLTPGSGVGGYDVQTLKVIGGGRLSADNPVVVRVAGSLKVTGKSQVGPTPGSPLLAGDVQFAVGGAIARLGRGANIQAHVFGPNATILIGRGTNAQGRFVGQKVLVQKGAAVHLIGGCGDGALESGEVCDASAPNGDGACPGKCIAGDPQGLGRIELGKAGQCTCPCSGDADCDDHNACNGVETCDAGHCVLGTPPNCDDNNPCTIDCEAAVGCVSVKEPDGTSCDDGNQCTRNDTCQNGVCVGGPPRTCSDGNDCTSDACDPAHGCTHTTLPNGTACEDGNACTAGDICIRGFCASGAAVDCNDLNPCTADSCNPLTGCLHENITNGVSCAGPSPCTVDDVCLNGTCQSGAATLCNDSNPCTIDSCQLTGPVGAQQAQCVHTNEPDLTPCGAKGLVCFNGVCH
jgi:hypothetical protein